MINSRPRKCLGFKQTAIVFEEIVLAAWAWSGAFRS